MAKRRGSNAQSAQSRQLGSGDTRGRRNAQINSVHLGSSDTVSSKNGKAVVRVGKTLKSTPDGLEVVPAKSVANSIDTVDIVAQFNLLLSELRAANFVEE